MVKKMKTKTKTKSWRTYQTPEEKARLTWATSTLERREKIEQKAKVGEWKAIEQRKSAQQIIDEAERPSEEERAAKREIIAGHLRGSGRAVGAEARRIVTSRRPSFDYKKAEGFVVTRPKRLKRIRLKYQPMAKNMFEAGRESNPWR